SQGQSQSADQPSSSLLLLGARGGYYLPLSDALGAWFQGGLSYASASSTQPPPPNTMGGTESSVSLSEVWINAGALAVLPVVEHLSLTGGAYFDGTLTGTATQKEANVSQDNKAGELAYGLTIGVLGYLGGE